MGNTVRSRVDAASPRAMDLRQNDLVSGRYRVDRLIGAGTFGEVWVGDDVETGERVALKKTRASVASDDMAVRFRREAYFLARVQSEHVARIIDFVPDEGGILVMQFVEGEALSEVLQRRTLSVEETIDLGVDLLAGVRDLHAARILHRDLKAGNVILHPTRGGRFRAVIVDFGLGRLAGHGADGEESTGTSMTELTRSNIVLGTLPYMAPEQILNSRQVTQQSDVYSAGAILFRAVSGRHAFDADVAPRVLANAKLTQNAPPLSIGRDDWLAHELEAIIDKAIKRLPGDRWKDASEMLAALERLQRAHAEEATDTGDRTIVAAPPSEPTDAGPDTARNLARDPKSRPSISRLTPTAPFPVAPHASAPVVPPPPPPAERSRAPYLVGAVVLFAAGMAAGGLLVRHLVQPAGVATSASAVVSSVALVTSAPVAATPPTAVTPAPSSSELELADVDAAPAAVASAPSIASAASVASVAPRASVGPAVAPAIASGPTPLATTATGPRPRPSTATSSSPLPVRIESTTPDDDIH